MELRILSLLDWNLTCVTMYHFIEAFISYGILFPEDNLIYDNDRRRVRKY